MKNQFYEKPLTIFIINFNGVSYLRDLFFKCLNSFVREVSNSNFIDLWFVDNGSTDYSLDVVKARYGSKLKYLALSHNLGYGAACNIAYEYVKRLGLRYKYYICSNNDIEIYPGRLKKLIQWLQIVESKHSKGFIASLIFINGYDNFIDVANYFVDDMGGTWPLRLILLNKDITEKILRKPIPVSYSDGAFIITHWRVIEEIGWFDPHTFLYYEDTELSLRAWNYGYPSFLLPVILGKHYRSISTRRMHKMLLYFSTRNKIYSVICYMDLISFFKIMLWYLSYLFRILEVKNPKMQDLMRKILPGVIIYEINSISLSLLSSFLKYAIRAFIDGIIMALKRRKECRKGISSNLLLHINIIDMFSQKRIITKLQKQVKRHVLNRSAL